MTYNSPNKSYISRRRAVEQLLKSLKDVRLTFFSFTEYK